MQNIEPQISYLKLIFAIIMSLYFLSIAIWPEYGSFLLDLVDLAIHETGHLVFMPFGQFMMVAGGTILQLVFPALFVAYFVWDHKYYSASIVLFWFGQSFFHVWIYAADAVVMQLMLTSGMTGSEGGFHDWNYMLDTLGLLWATPLVAGVFRAIGTIIIIAAAAFSIYHSIYARPEEFDQNI